MNNNNASIVAEIAALSFGMGGCNPTNSPGKYSKIEPCGEYGVQFIEDGDRRIHKGNADIFEVSNYLEGSKSLQVMQNTRHLIRACESATKMTSDDLGESVIRAAKIVLSDDQISICMESKECFLYDEVMIRSEWAVQKGIPTSCYSVTQNLRTEYSSNLKTSQAVLDRSLNILDSLCTVNYYQTIIFAEGN